MFIKKINDVIKILEDKLRKQFDIQSWNLHKIINNLLGSPKETAG